MPSDISKPGALAFESIPARSDNSEAYAQQSVKRELARIFSRDGCHHCGEHCCKLNLYMRLLLLTLQLNQPLIRLSAVR